MRYLFISIILIILINPQTATGQAYNFINFDITDGLAHNRVTDITEDQFGNLWLSTAGGGLSKFNGLTFKNYTIKDGLGSNYIRDIICDKRGNIWAATAEGISKLDGFEIKNFIADSIAGNNNSVNVLHESSNGSIWFSAPAGGLGRVDSMGQVIVEKIPGLISADRIIDIEEDIEGNIWFVSAIQGLFKYDGNEYVKVINNSAYRGYLLSIEQNSDGKFYVGTNRGVFLFDPLNSSSDIKRLVSDIFIKSVEVIDSSNFWIVSPSGALYKNNDMLKVIGTDQGLTNRGINSIFKDREGNVWFASDGEGLFKLTNKTFRFLGARHGLNTLPVTSIVKDDSDHYWFGSFGNGLTKWNGNTFIEYGQEDGLSSNYISSSAIDKNGVLWFGTRGAGLVKYDGNRFTTLNTSDGLVHDIIRQLFVDSDNNLWVGTINGLSKYDGTTFKNFDTNSGLFDNLIWTISEPDQNEILIATRKGINTYSGDSLHQLELPSELFDNRINTAKKDKEGNFWIGYSGHGLVKISPNGSETTYTTENGLGSDLIYSLVFDANNDLVVGTERGVYKLFLSDQRGLESRIKKYGQVEGFANLQTTSGSHYKDENSIWYGNNEGVFIYDLEQEKINQVEPIIYLSGLRLFSDIDSIDWSKYAEDFFKWTNIPRSLKLNFDDNNLVINYFATSLTNPTEVVYKYRLVGLDDNWSAATRRSEVAYTNLSPGKYSFEVLAANSDNIWTSVPAKYDFEITPPFWQTWWFYVVMLVFIVLLLKGINDYRIKVSLDKILLLEKIRSEEQKRARKIMARDFHDNLGNQLASISVYINLINLKLKSRSKEVDDLLTSIQKNAGNLFSGTKDFIWSMDPDSDELSEIYTYIKDFGEELFEKTQIDFYASANDLEDKIIPLRSGWSRQLVLIFKEAMTNALKHSQATEVHLKLRMYDEHFSIMLSDNGKGLDNECKVNSLGIKSMINRAEQIGATISFETENEGTRVVLRAGIPKNDFKHEIKT